MELKQITKITDKEVEILVESQTTFYNDDSNYHSEDICFLSPLVPIKEELTILGGALLRRTDVKKFSSDDFYVMNVRKFWEQLEENTFNLDNIDFNKLSYYYDYGTSKIHYEDFIKIVKQLAENTTDTEFQIIFQKLYKMNDIRECCQKMKNDLENCNKKDFFENRYELLKYSSRLETLSIHQIKKFLTPLNIVDTTDIINSGTALAKSLTSLLIPKTENIKRGVDLAFPLMTKAINGLQKGQFIATGMLSNNGKTRLMIRNIASLVLKHNKKVLIISNEMTEDDLMYCFITTVINNNEFKEMFGTTDFSKNERDITDIIDLFKKGLIKSDKIIDIIGAISEKIENNIYIIHTDNYSDEILTEIVLAYYMAYDVDYFFYDTLKADKTNMSNWDGMKVTATILSELAKTYNICIWSSIQLVDDSKYDTSPLALSYKNIANSKQVYHVLDTLFLFSKVEKKDYSQYVYWENSDNPTKDTIKELKPLGNGEKYYICRVNKNRLGAKPDLLFKVNLNQNTWEELGQVCYRERVKEIMNG